MERLREQMAVRAAGGNHETLVSLAFVPILMTVVVRGGRLAAIGRGMAFEAIRSHDSLRHVAFFIATMRMMPAAAEHRMQRQQCSRHVGKENLHQSTILVPWAGVNVERSWEGAWAEPATRRP